MKKDATATVQSAAARAVLRPRGATVDRRIQSLGEKGQRTRASIIAKTVEMLAEKPLSEITMANISKELRLDKTAFYRYFRDVGDVILAALTELTAEAEGLLPTLEFAWSDRELHESATRFVDAYYAVWVRYADLIRARNSLLEGGDKRFLDSRRKTATALALALAKRVQGPEQREAPAITIASVLMMALERAATVAAHGTYKDQGWYDLRRGIIEIIVSACAAPTGSARPRT